MVSARKLMVTRAEDDLHVFVSSVIKELKKERDIVKESIESLGIARSWLFEYSPASPNPIDFVYLQKVSHCEIFILILGQTITKPVQQEFDTAKNYDRPILVFLKENVSRDKALETFLDQLRIKRIKFSNDEELENVVKTSISDYIIQRFRLTDSDRAKLQGARPTAVDRLTSDRYSAAFTTLKRAQIKDPLEIIKEAPKQDKVLPLMSQMLNFNSIEEQIKFVEQTGYADIYTDSWAERELQIIGLYVLEKLSNYMDITVLTNMYDAGCANRGQYQAFQALLKLNMHELNEKFRYDGQDFNPDWKQRFENHNGSFFQKPLPLTAKEKEKYDLVSCTHALHYLGHNLIAIYTSLFSFNRLLKLGAYCYITVPEKTTQPGMLDILERAASDAKFQIVESGKSRLVHKIMEPPHNITTFIYLILKKNGDINELEWRRLLGASFFRAKYRNLAEHYGVKSEGDINEPIRLSEIDLTELLNERNYCLRTFRQMLDIANNDVKIDSSSLEVCQRNIKKLISEIHDLVLEPKKRDTLEIKCANYLYWLARFYVISCEVLDKRDIVYHVYPLVKRVLTNQEDIRVNIDNLTEEQAAKLLKHFFEFIQYEGIDIGEQIRTESFERWVTHH